MLKQKAFYPGKTTSTRLLNSYGRIGELLKELSPKMRTIVLNSIYFEAGWTHKFDKELTAEEDFIKEDGNTRKVQMMHSKAMVRYAENDDCQMLCLPYGGFRTNPEMGWNMYLLLPKKGKTVKEMLDRFDNNMWKSLRNKEESTVLDFGIPKFKVASETSLKEVLSGMGVKDIFDKSGSLNRMFENLEDGVEGPVVTYLYQKSGIDVDEKGGKVITITVGEVLDRGGGSADGGPIQTRFLANRPFVYLISENSSGTIFFTGVYHGE